METTLCWIAIAIGLAGILAGLLARGRRRPWEGLGDGAWIAALVTILAAVAMYLLTRLVRPPFELGERMGYGILIGAILGARAGVWATRDDEREPWRSWIEAAASPATALLGVGIVLLLFGDYPEPVLGGFVIGAVMAAILFRFAVPRSQEAAFWAISAATLGAATMLAVFRYHSTAERFWWRAPIAVLTSAIIAHFAAAALVRRGRSLVLPMVVSSLVTLALTAVFAWRLFPDWSLLCVAVAGIGTLAIVTWLSYAAPGSVKAAAAAAVIVIAFSTLAFRMMAGFGIGIGLLAATPLLISFTSIRREQEEEEGLPRPEQTAFYAAFIAIGIMLLRLFLETYSSDLRGLDLKAHYTFIALALGAVFPFVLMSFISTPHQRRIGWRLASAGALGVFSAASPLVILAVWNFKAAFGFLIGSIIAEILILFIQTGAVTMREKGYLPSALLVLAAQASALQFSGLVGPIAEEPRLTKVIILASVLVLGLVWAGVSALLDRGLLRQAQDGAREG